MILAGPRGIGKTAALLAFGDVCTTTATTNASRRSPVKSTPGSSQTALSHRTPPARHQPECILLMAPEPSRRPSCQWVGVALESSV